MSVDFSATENPALHSACFFGLDRESSGLEKFLVMGPIPEFQRQEVSSVRRGYT